MWKIVELKGNIEKKEAYEYHIERWGTISSLYFKSFEYSNWGSHLIYSYIFNGDEYVSQPDKNMGFFYETGISYQVRCLLLCLFNCPNDYNKVDWKDMLKCDDKLYGGLTKK